MGDHRSFDKRSFRGILKYRLVEAGARFLDACIQRSGLTTWRRWFAAGTMAMLFMSTFQLSKSKIFRKAGPKTEGIPKPEIRKNKHRPSTHNTPEVVAQVLLLLFILGPSPSVCTAQSHLKTNLPPKLTLQEAPLA